MKRSLAFFVLLLICFAFLSCPFAKHCDLRFCEFVVETKTFTEDKDLMYEPVFTTSNPCGHRITEQLLLTRYRKYPEKDVIYTINDVSQWSRTESFYYIFPQAAFDTITDNKDTLRKILSGELETYEFEGNNYKCKYTNEEFKKFDCPSSAPGYFAGEVVYYCIFSGHVPKV